MAEAVVGTAVYPCPSGSRLDFQWGFGRELLLADTSSSSTQQAESSFGMAQWDEPSSAQRQVAFDTMQLYQALHTQALADQDRTVRLQSILEYSQEIAVVLRAACGRPAASDPGQPLVGEDCCAWELLQLFYVLAPRLEGSVTQDLVMWFKQHNLLLQGPEGSVHEVYNAVLANITEEEAASQTVPGYWQAIQRLVLVGWTADARDLLYLHSDMQAAEDRHSMLAENAAGHLLDQTDALLRRMPLVQPISGQSSEDGAYMSLAQYTDAKEAWKGDCLKLLDSPLWWDDCQSRAPETAEGLRITLSIMAGDRQTIDDVAMSWLELVVGTLLYGLPSKGGTRQHVGTMVTQCLSQRLGAGHPSPPGQFLTLMEELLPGAAEMDTPRVLSAVSQLSLWFKAHMPDILTATPQGRSALQTTLEHEGGDLTEKLTLAYAHSLMPYPSIWHVAAAYLAWCPFHGAAAMEQLLSHMRLDQGDVRLANQLVQQCQLYGLPQVGVGICRHMGTLHCQAGRTAAALSWFIRGHDESRASDAVASVVRQVEDMLADTASGFHPIPELCNLEGLLTSMAPAEAQQSQGKTTNDAQQAQNLVQHRGTLGFLQGFLKLQQAMTQVVDAKDQNQVKMAAQCVRDIVMVLVVRKVAPQQTWLHLLFHIIPIMDGNQSSVFSHKDCQTLLTRTQEASAWLPKDDVHQRQELTVVRLALARSVAQAHINAFRPAITASA